MAVVAGEDRGVCEEGAPRVRLESDKESCNIFDFIFSIADPPANAWHGGQVASTAVVVST